MPLKTMNFLLGWFASSPINYNVSGFFKILIVGSMLIYSSILYYNYISKLNVISKKQNELKSVSNSSTLNQLKLVFTLFDPVPVFLTKPIVDFFEQMINQILVSSVFANNYLITALGNNNYLICFIPTCLKVIIYFILSPVIFLFYYLTVVFSWFTIPSEDVEKNDGKVNISRSITYEYPVVRFIYKLLHDIPLILNVGLLLIWYCYSLFYFVVNYDSIINVISFSVVTMPYSQSPILDEIMSTIGLNLQGKFEFSYIDLTEKLSFINRYYAALKIIDIIIFASNFYLGNFYVDVAISIITKLIIVYLTEDSSIEHYVFATAIELLFINNSVSAYTVCLLNTIFSLYSVVIFFENDFQDLIVYNLSYLILLTISSWLISFSVGYLANYISNLLNTKIQILKIIPVLFEIVYALSQLLIIVVNTELLSPRTNQELFVKTFLSAFKAMILTYYLVYLINYINKFRLIYSEEKPYNIVNVKGLHNLVICSIIFLTPVFTNEINSGFFVVIVTKLIFNTFSWTVSKGLNFGVKKIDITTVILALISDLRFSKLNYILVSLFYPKAISELKKVVYDARPFDITKVLDLLVLKVGLGITPETKIWIPTEPTSKISTDLVVRNLNNVVGLIPDVKSYLPTVLSTPISDAYNHFIDLLRLQMSGTKKIMSMLNHLYNTVAFESDKTPFLNKLADIKNAPLTMLYCLKLVMFNLLILTFILVSGYLVLLMVDSSINVYNKLILGTLVCVGLESISYFVDFKINLYLTNCLKEISVNAILVAIIVNLDKPNGLFDDGAQTTTVSELITKKLFTYMYEVLKAPVLVFRTVVAAVINKINTYSMLYKIIAVICSLLPLIKLVLVICLLYAFWLQNLFSICYVLSLSLVECLNIFTTKYELVFSDYNSVLLLVCNLVRVLVFQAVIAVFFIGLSQQTMIKNYITKARTTMFNTINNIPLTNIYCNLIPYLGLYVLQYTLL